MASKIIGAGRCATRRGFLKDAGLLGAGLFGSLLVTGCAPDAQPADQASGDGGTTVSVAGSSGTPPFSYLNEDGELTGFDIDVLREVDARLDDYSFDFTGMDFTAMLTALESGNVQLATCEFCPNEERKEKYIFCQESFNIMPMVFAVRDPSIKTLDDLAGMSTIMNPSNYEYTIIQEYNEKNPDKALDLQTVSGITMADAFKMIASGQYDSYMIGQSMFDSVNEETGAGLSCTDIVMCESAYFMLNDSQQDLADAIDGALKEMKEDGTLGEISKEYQGVDTFEEYADVLSDAQILS